MFEGALMPSHWLVLLVIVLIVFGAGKLPSVMGDLGRGVREFKRAQGEPDAAPSGPKAAPGAPGAAPVVSAAAAAPAQPAAPAQSVAVPSQDGRAAGSPAPRA